MSMAQPAGSGPRNTGTTIYERAVEYAQKRGYRFGDGADAMIRSHAMQAGEQIARMSEASRAFEKLIDAMIEAANEIPGYKLDRPHIIGEQTYGKALGKICPLWPFC
jgi:hypothetical protein